MLCLKRQRKRFLCFARGISPIDDDEIAKWKMSSGEKTGLVGAAAATAGSSESPGHAKHDSTDSVKKPPSVIVYPIRHSHHVPRCSGEISPRSVQNSHGVFDRSSLEKELPRTPLQAIAPNARAGLTDETIPGDNPFLPSIKRHPSRLSKAPPTSSTRATRTHTRTRSSRSSTRSFGDYGYYGGWDLELSPRASYEHFSGPRRSHSRVYSSPSIPPRLSLNEEGVMSPLTPRPPFRECEIGQAIG